VISGASLERVSRRSEIAISTISLRELKFLARATPVAQERNPIEP
jgi:hypothetical protein